jgi:hypothetical protein
MSRRFQAHARKQAPLSCVPLKCRRLGWDRCLSLGVMLHSVSVAHPQFVLDELPFPSRRLWCTKNALHTVSDAGITWVLFVTPDFPLRAANAGEGGLCRWWFYALDDLARNPDDVEKYQSKDSGKHQIFYFTSCGPLWVAC